MAELIRHKLPPDCNVYLSSDKHVGAKAWHKDAHEEFAETVRADPIGWWLDNGDGIEGKPTKSKHFDPRSLRPDMMTIEAQVDELVRIETPIADKCLGKGKGNHDIYLMPDFDVVRVTCERMERGWREKTGKTINVPLGGYQTVYDLGNGVRMFMYHGRKNMPRGAKDPIQRKANQNAWLVNTLVPLAGNCHLMGHGHVHTLHVQEPIEQLALLARGNSVRARHFYEPSQTVRTVDPATGKADVREYIPPLSRWYACTGTFRRSGGFGYLDYSEIAGYPPSLIGYQKVIIRNGVIQRVETVVV